MTALIAFISARPRLAAGLIAGAVLAALAGSIYIHGDRSGAQRVREDNARQDRQSQHEAAGVWQEVEHCNAAGGQWDATAGKCDMGGLL